MSWTAERLAAAVETYRMADAINCGEVAAIYRGRAAILAAELIGAGCE